MGEPPRAAWMFKGRQLGTPASFPGACLGSPVLGQFGLQEQPFNGDMIGP